LVEGASETAGQTQDPGASRNGVPGEPRAPSTTQEAEKALETLEGFVRFGRGLVQDFLEGEKSYQGDMEWADDALASLRSLRTQLEQVTKERDEAQHWMDFIARTQQKLLGAFHMELSDEEWSAFAHALGIDP
jgi:hypothetical protein